MDKYTSNIYLWDKPHPKGKLKPWKPMCNVYEEDERIVVVFELPGIDMEHCSLSFNHGILTLEGHRREFPRPGRGSSIQYHMIEISDGRFERNLKVSVNIDSTKITAHYDRGFLTVKLPKMKEKNKPRSVKIKIK